MNEVYLKYSRKARKLSKNGKFVTSKTQMFLFPQFYLFHDIKTSHSIGSFIYLVLSEKVLSETANLTQQRKKIKKSHKGNMQQIYSQF